MRRRVLIGLVAAVAGAPAAPAAARITTWDVVSVEHTTSTTWRYRGGLSPCETEQPRVLGGRWEMRLVSFTPQPGYRHHTQFLGPQRRRIRGLVGGIRYSGGRNFGVAGPLGLVRGRATYEIEVDVELERCGVVRHDDPGDGSGPVPVYGPTGQTYTESCRQRETFGRWRVLLIEPVSLRRVELIPQTDANNRCSMYSGVAESIGSQDTSKHHMRIGPFKRRRATIRVTDVATAPSRRTRLDVSGRQETTVTVELRRRIRRDQCLDGGERHDPAWVCTY